MMAIAHYIRLLLVFLLLPTTALGQSGKNKKIEYFDEHDVKLLSPKGAKYAIEVTFLDSLRAIEKIYLGPQKVKEATRFSNIHRRIRDGEAVAYYDDGSIKRRDIYRDGFRQGEGVAYYANGKIRRQDLYDKRKLVEEKCFDVAGRLIDCEILARQSGCPDTFKIPANATTTVARYPPKALKLRIQGDVKVQFAVNRFGKITDVWILESPSPYLNEEALATVRRIKQWSIHYVDCEPTDALYILPLKFRIN